MPQTKIQLYVNRPRCAKVTAVTWGSILILFVLSGIFDSAAMQWFVLACVGFTVLAKTICYADSMNNLSINQARAKLDQLEAEEKRQPIP